MKAVLLNRWEPHKAVGSIPSKAKPLDYETVRRIGLHIERESKCEKAYDVHPQPFQTVSHIDRCGS